jgi:hypothetical protein
MCLFCVVLCLGRGLATSWSLVQGVLPSVKWSWKWKAEARAQGGCRASEKKKHQHYRHQFCFCGFVPLIRNLLIKRDLFGGFKLTIITHAIIRRWKLNLASIYLGDVEIMRLHKMLVSLHLETQDETAGVPPPCSLQHSQIWNIMSDSTCRSSTITWRDPRPFLPLWFWISP